ncbi:hypothetical protein [Parasitella parasitica]|uniref:Uncharacterized protein n=1 Tax=Parasitella parasitica TaxID=35722 RepID=A0A0B7MZI1_9FUNG|nr:hypothetical protein [Parasitella parasitica]
MEELPAEQTEGIHDVRMIFREEGPPDVRRYNGSASEVGVLIVGGDDENEQPRNRDIVLQLKGLENGLTRINEIHPIWRPFISS